MTVAIADLKAAFPEFTTSGDAELSSAIAFAESSTSDTWGTRRDRVVMLTAAAHLCTSPMARNARSEGKEAPNRYQTELDRLRASLAAINPLRVGVPWR